jgi:hypothetical protein
MFRRQVVGAQAAADDGILSMRAIRWCSRVLVDQSRRKGRIEDRPQHLWKRHNRLDSRNLAGRLRAHLATVRRCRFLTHLLPRSLSPCNPLFQPRGQGHLLSVTRARSCCRQPLLCDSGRCLSTQRMRRSICAVHELPDLFTFHFRAQRGG